MIRGYRNSVYLYLWNSSMWIQIRASPVPYTCFTQPWICINLEKKYAGNKIVCLSCEIWSKITNAQEGPIISTSAGLKKWAAAQRPTHRPGDDLWLDMNSRGSYQKGLGNCPWFVSGRLGGDEWISDGVTVKITVSNHNKLRVANEVTLYLVAYHNYAGMKRVILGYWPLQIACGKKGDDHPFDIIYRGGPIQIAKQLRAVS